MSNPFKIPRYPDKQIVDKLKRFATEITMKEPQLWMVLFPGANGQNIPFDAIESNDLLKEVFAQNNSVMPNIGISVIVPPHNNRSQIITINRIGKDLFDEVAVEWSNPPRIAEAQFIRLVAMAKGELREIKFDGSSG